MTTIGVPAPNGVSPSRGCPPRTIAASRRQRFLGGCLAAAAVLYLVPFVPRGWVPHDEGMLGQIADWALHGDIPHLDYQDPYTGGLSWLYAALFKIVGVDLLYVRWLLFA